MTRADIPTERLPSPVSGIGRRSWQGESKAGGGADAGAEVAFPELLSRLVEVASGPVVVHVPTGLPDVVASALPATQGDGDRMPEVASIVPAGGDVAPQSPTPADLLSGASMLAALLASGAPAPSGAPPPLASDGDVTDIARQLTAVVDPEAAHPPLQAETAQGLPDPEPEPGQPAPSPKVTVLRQETHLAPVPASMPAAQPAERLAATGLASTRPDGKTAVAIPESRTAPRNVIPSGEVDGGEWAPPSGVPAARETGSGSVSMHRPSDGRAALAAGGREDGTSTSQSLPDATEGVVTLRKDSDPTSLPSPPSPSAQVADRVARESATLAAPARPEVSVAGLARPVASGAVKMLHIELQPVDLGTVTVRMTLKDGGLDLQLNAGREETARMLQQDRDTLSGILRNAGFQVDAMTVRVGEPDRTASAPPASSTFSGQAQTESQPGSAQPDARSSGGQARAGRQASDLQRSVRTSHDQESGAAHRLGRDLYI